MGNWPFTFCEGRLLANAVVILPLALEFVLLEGHWAHRWFFNFYNLKLNDHVTWRWI